MLAATTQKPKATRQTFGEVLTELGEKYPEIVVLEADLGKSTKSELFGKKFPTRYFQMGIAEANMVGTGSGIALCGHTVFVCSFGCFVTGRYDTIRMSVAYANANIRIVGTHAGLGIGDDGHSQMGLEDLGLMRELPGMTVLQPCDEIETRAMMAYLVGDYHGPAYLRLTRQALAPVHDASYTFRPGKFDWLKQGHQVALIGTGAGVQECLGACDLLKNKGLEVSVINAPTIKPFDSKGVQELSANHRIFVTVEDHYVNGGLGSVVAESIAELGLNQSTKLVRLGVQDQFGESGDPSELYEKFGFSSKKIAEKILTLL